MTKLETSSLSSKLRINRDSRAISKFKSEIRIVHVFAPEIIETDAANFQRVSSKKTHRKPEEGSAGSKSKTAPTEDAIAMDSDPKEALIIRDEEEFLSLQNGVRVKDEHEEEEGQNGSLWESSFFFSGFFF
ncbi:LOW QUALITY PROTEIN: VQ motif-containing protein 18-like [Vigna umbellata]|uniref:LOW QUALITY PROTEIN: VQ motif-containing protein 18-like n=1 Tax=Vigna umbellata TaxID=87088 RepID=UPI001F5E61B9|nr:LOW QUALITY PROTEIN: VQ motif-containing protein 18-like [Vigna umbellata]